jgi:hypothetical protein
MPSEWRVTSNIIGDEKRYRVYRLKDKKTVDHSGNREFAMDKYIESRQICETLAENMNYGKSSTKITRADMLIASVLYQEYCSHGAWE